MQTTNNFLKNMDKFAGATALIFIGIGIAQIILSEYISKSVALTANGIDCIGDGFVSAVVWIGLRFFRKPADDKFHFGYYKIENLASIAAAVVMILLAGYISYRSYLQLINPINVNSPVLGAFVALIAALIAWGLGIYKYIKGKNTNLNSVKLEGFNTIKDGTSSFLVVVALIFNYYGYYIADAIVGFIIAGIIVSIGFAAIKESSYMLIDACDGTCVLQGDIIKKITEKIPGVISVHMIRLRRSGPIAQGEIEIKVSADMSVLEFDKIRKKILKLIKEKYPDIERLIITPIPS
jgi:cation diffusion facilitator family transporter